MADQIAERSARVELRQAEPSEPALGSNREELRASIASMAESLETEKHASDDHGTEITRRVDYVAYTSEVTADTLAQSPVDNEGFYGHNSVYVKDEFGRPLSAEAWVAPEPGRHVTEGVRNAVMPSVRNAVMPSVRDGLNASHLLSRFAGGELEGNVVPFSQEANNRMSAFESHWSQVAQTQDVYLRAFAFYNDAGKQPSIMELQIYQRCEQGTPMLQDRCRVSVRDDARERSH